MRVVRNVARSVRHDEGQPKQSYNQCKTAGIRCKGRQISFMHMHPALPQTQTQNSRRIRHPKMWDGKRGPWIAAILDHGMSVPAERACYVHACGQETLPAPWGTEQ